MTEMFANTESSRRGFLQSALLGAGALGGLTNVASAADAPQRNGKSHMKLSLAAYSFREHLSRSGGPAKREPKMTLFDFIDICAGLDLDGTELTSYYFPKEVTHEYLMELKAASFRLGLDISGTAIGNNFCVPDGPDRDAQLKLCRDWIDHAAAMGAPVIRIFAGRVANGETEEIALDRCVAGINESLDYAAQKGVFLALENHGGITSTPEQWLAIVKRVKPSPWFGGNFDSGNFHTEDPYGDLAKIAPYAVNAQIKVKIGQRGSHQPADLERIVKILKDAEYRGYVVLEYEEKDPLKGIPDVIKRLRAAIRA
ncbi:MAG: xylose isomerase [Planctomycetaceae bacterium]|nr:xylose isomerase [Planctomycetaceae bacterium]